MKEKKAHGRGQGLTRSKGGVALSKPGNKCVKRKRNYPLSWGTASEEMRMKKRVLCVFDGRRRLGKDDMMMSDAEMRRARIALPDGGQGSGRRWITGLDLQTLKRAEGLLGATEEEKGPWLNEAGELIEDGALVAGFGQPAMAVA